MPSRPGISVSKFIPSCTGAWLASRTEGLGEDSGPGGGSQAAGRSAPHPGPRWPVRRPPLARTAPRPRLLARRLGRCRRDSALLAGRPAAAAAARRGLLPPRHPLSPPTPAPGRGAFPRAAAARRTPRPPRHRADHGAPSPPPPPHPPARLPADAGPSSQQGEPRGPAAPSRPGPRCRPLGRGDPRPTEETSGEATAEPAPAPLGIRWGTTGRDVTCAPDRFVCPSPENQEPSPGRDVRTSVATERFP